MKKVILSAVLSLCALTTAAQATDEVVNIYSYRQPFLIEPFLEKFTEKTGVKTKVVFAKKGIFERVKAEGEQSPADLILTVDIANLTAAAGKHDLAQPIESEVVEQNIPAQYIADDKKWLGLTSRVRVIATSKDRMPMADAPKTYEDLADPKYKGKICIRSGKNKYNVSLLASMIAAHGEAEAKKWLEGVKANLARKPQGNDRAQVKGIVQGVCDIAVLNQYYIGKMLAKEEQKDWVDQINVIFPNQGEGERGSHANVSGVVLVKSAPNKANAIKLIEFLTGDVAQKMYAEANYEYPLNQSVSASDLVTSWGEHRVDSVSMNKIAELRGQALNMVDEVAFDAE